MHRFLAALALAITVLVGAAALPKDADAQVCGYTATWYATAWTCAYGLGAIDGVPVATVATVPVAVVAPVAVYPAYNYFGAYSAWYGPRANPWRYHRARW